MQQPQLRAATAEDCEAIAQLHAASWRYAYRNALGAKYLAENVDEDRRRLWRERMRNPNAAQHVIVAPQDASLLGFACVYTGADARWGSLLDNIHVTQSLHRCGLGTRLLQAAAGHCARHAGNGGLFLWVLQDNLAAQNFYAKHHAENVGTDVWDAPGGNQVPRFRVAWPASALKGLSAAA